MNQFDLTRDQIIQASKDFVPFGSRDLSKFLWTVKVEGNERPARQLVLRAMGKAPNASLNSYQAVEILKKLGFEVIFKGLA